MKRWRKSNGCHWSLQMCFVRFFPVDTLGIFGGDLFLRRLSIWRWRHCGSRMGDLLNYRNARLSMSGACFHIVDGRAHSAADWAGGRQSAARWSARGGGVHVGKMFRRRRRQAGLLGEKAAPPTQRVPCDLQGACGPAEERAGVASRLYGVPQLGARCRGGRQEESPRHTEERLSCG
ncbi:hypothetical protein TcCL_ESM11132, partial [Trypanosoma cruzi]